MNANGAQNYCFSARLLQDFYMFYNMFFIFFALFSHYIWSYQNFLLTLQAERNIA